MPTIRGKSLKAITYDIAEGYVVVNPIFLKPLDDDSLKGLYHEIDEDSNRDQRREISTW